MAQSGNEYWKYALAGIIATAVIALLALKFGGGQ